MRGRRLRDTGEGEARAAGSRRREGEGNDISNNTVHLSEQERVIQRSEH